MNPDRVASGTALPYAMIFASVVADVAVVPLLPTLTRRYRLSSLETALLLSTTTFAMVVVTLPLGRLADRIGARPLIVCAGGFVVLGSIVMALAGSLPELLAGRALIGIANGIIWTAGVMLAGAPGRPAGATGRAIAAGGTGLLVGPRDRRPPRRPRRYVDAVRRRCSARAACDGALRAPALDRSAPRGMPEPAQPPARTPRTATAWSSTRCSPPCCSASSAAWGICSGRCA